MHYFIVFLFLFGVSICRGDVYNILCHHIDICVVLFVTVPETKGRSLENISAALKHG